MSILGANTNNGSATVVDSSNVANGVTSKSVVQVESKASVLTEVSFACNNNTSSKVAMAENSSVGVDSLNLGGVAGISSTITIAPGSTITIHGSAIVGNIILGKNVSIVFSRESTHKAPKVSGVDDLKFQEGGNNNYDGSDSGGSLGLLVNENQEVEVEVEVAGVVSCASAA